MRAIPSSLLLLSLPLIVGSVPQPAAAAPPAYVIRQLMKLSPSTRIEQRCNRHAGRAIRRETKIFMPTRS